MDNHDSGDHTGLATNPEATMPHDMAKQSAASIPIRPQISLLGGFGLAVASQSVTLPFHASRVLAYLSLVQPPGGTRTRTALAERLWPDAPPERSLASLRTALWRIRQADRRLVRTCPGGVRLGDQVEVDVHLTRAAAIRLGSEDHELHAPDLEVSTLVGDLLPDWDEDWLILERERIHQIQIHALEALAQRLALAGRYSHAIDVAFAAIVAEPLRESAHSILIDIHLAEGNLTEARKQFARYAEMLQNELGERPSAELTARIGIKPIPTLAGPPNSRTHAKAVTRGVEAQVALTRIHE